MRGHDVSKGETLAAALRPHRERVVDPVPGLFEEPSTQKVPKC